MVAFQNVLPKFNPEKRCKPKSLNQSSSFRLGFKSNENEVAQLKKELKEHNILTFIPSQIIVIINQINRINQIN